MVKNKEIILTKDDTKAISFAEAKDITGPEDMKKAVSMRYILKDALKKLVAEKEKVTKPLNEALKQERLRFSPYEEKFKTAIESLDNKMSSYQTEQKRLAQIEEEKIASRTKEGKGNFSTETAIKKMEEVDRPDKRVATDDGKATFVTVPKFSVEDISKLPVEYLLANEVLIRKAMLEGTKLPGVKYWTEERPRSF